MTNLLAAAAYLIDQRGWNQGDYCSPTGKLCAVGAIIAAYQEGHGCPPEDVDYYGFGLPETNEAIRKLERCINNGASTFDRIPVPSWNDDPSRTQAEVTAALREAAEL